MTAVRNELPYMQLKERYVKVKLKGTKGPSCIIEPREVSDFCDGNDSEYELEDIWLTWDEAEALPEFEGF
jgi:hypothetical protein